MPKMEIPTLSPNLSNDHAFREYPYVEVLDQSDALALVLPSLPRGELSVLCTYKGDTRRLAKIANSALELNKLRKVTRLVYCKSAEDKREIKTAIDIMEVLI